MDGVYDPIVIEVAPGELIDKITILEIKGESVRANHQLKAIQYEYASLMRVLEEAMDIANEEHYYNYLKNSKYSVAGTRSLSPSSTSEQTTNACLLLSRCFFIKA